MVSGVSPIALFIALPAVTIHTHLKSCFVSPLQGFWVVAPQLLHPYKIGKQANLLVHIIIYSRSLVIRTPMDDEKTVQLTQWKSMLILPRIIRLSDYRFRYRSKWLDPGG